MEGDGKGREEGEGERCPNNCVLLQNPLFR